MATMGPCVGCFIETDTAVAFRGPDEWILAALMTIMATDDVDEAQRTLDEFHTERQKHRPRSGSIPRARYTPAPDRGMFEGWKTIHVGCCASCAALGHFEVTAGMQVPCYVPPVEI